MIRRLCRLVLALSFVLCVCGCAEDESKITQEKTSTTESTPTDVSPGEMIVE